MCPYLYGTLLFEKFTERSKLTLELKLHSNTIANITYINTIANITYINTIANITYINTFNNKIQNKESLRALKRDLKYPANLSFASHPYFFKSLLYIL